MFPFLFWLYNAEPIFFSENEAQVLRDLVDALKTQQIHNFTIKSLFYLGNFYFKKCYKD